MIRLGKSQPNYPELAPQKPVEARTIKSKGKVRGKHLSPVEPKVVLVD